MQVDTQEFLNLVEETGKLVFVDIEANGLKGDYNSTICVSFKPFGKEPYTFSIKQPGNDKRVVREAKDELEKYSAWVTYYGRCMVPETKVCTADLRWVPLGDLSCGDELLGFDPEPSASGRRKWRKTSVLSAVHEMAETVTVELDNGRSFTVTPEHPFLVRGQRPPHNYRWVVAGNGRCSRNEVGVRVGETQLTEIVPFSERIDSFDAGWLAGIYDGEGCISGNGGFKQQISLSQKDGPVTEKICELLERFGYEYSIRAYDKDHKYMRAILLHGGQRDIRRFLMEIRPIRILNNWVITGAMKSDFIPAASVVRSVRPSGRKDIVRLMTGTGTYVAEGYGQHNCFDIPFLNTRLLKWGYEPITKRPHLDMYWAGKAHLLTAHRSQAHMLDWLGTPERKMSVSASTWSELGFKFDDNLKILIERCESDVTGLEALYKKIRHVVVEIKK